MVETTSQTRQYLEHKLTNSVESITKKTVGAVREQIHDKQVIRESKALAFTTFLYFLHGISSSFILFTVPYLLQDRFSVTDVAIFSIITYPFMFKLLVAPIVDSVYWKRFGIRKSWLVPLQFSLGWFLLITANYSSQIFYNKSSDGVVDQGQPRMLLLLLTGLFISCNLSCQEIAIDGLVIDIVRRRNRGQSSMCQMIGTSLGQFIGFPLFIALNNPKLKEIRILFGLLSPYLSLSTLLKVVAFAYCILALIVAMCYHEKDRHSPHERRTNLRDGYRQLIEIMKLQHMKSLFLAMALSGVGFAVEQQIVPIKLLNNDLVDETHLRRVAIISAPVCGFFFFVATYIASRWDEQEAFSLWRVAFRLRIGLFIFSFFITLLPQFSDVNKEMRDVFYLCLVAISSAYIMSNKLQGVSQNSFFAKISDRTCGGTYMTLCRTISEYGGRGFALLATYLVDMLTFKFCPVTTTSVASPSSSEFNLSATSVSERFTSNASEYGPCISVMNAVHVIAFLFIVLSFFTNRLSFTRLSNISRLDKNLWRIHKEHESEKQQLLKKEE